MLVYQRDAKSSVHGIGLVHSGDYHRQLEGPRRTFAEMYKMVLLFVMLIALNIEEVL